MLSVAISTKTKVLVTLLFLVLFFFYRDSVISTLRTVCALRGVALGARLSGKIKAVFSIAGNFLADAELMAAMPDKTKILSVPEL